MERWRWVVVRFLREEVLRKFWRGRRLQHLGHCKESLMGKPNDIWEAIAVELGLCSFV